MRYAELKSKTYFSFLTGSSSPEELIRRSAELGLSALGIADCNGVYGIPKAYQAKKEFPNLKLLVGAEISLELPASRSFKQALTLYARDRKAYGLLCRMLTACHAGKPKGGAFLSWNELTTFLEFRESAGLIALPGLFESDPFVSVPEFYLDTLSDRFRSRLFTPLLRLRDGKDRFRTQEAVRIQKRYGAPIVATNDVHYHIQRRSRLQDVMTAIRSGKSLQETGFRLFSNAERYLKSPERMARLFSDMPEAVSRTADVADLCTFCPSELKYQYPSEWIPAGYTAQAYLEELTWKGAYGRYPDGIPDSIRQQVSKELALIQQLRFADYFLTIHEIVDFAKSRDILCQGRGSAANSVVCYCLGITAVDPSRMELLFERFISAERGEPPDIDVDFEHERREEVIQHIYEKYGRDRAAMVSAVVTYQRRSAFREIAKALGVDVGTLSAHEVQGNFKKAAAKSGVEDCERLVEELSEEMTGFPRHLSIHSGGFTLSAGPIIEIVPVEPARMEGRTIIQWDKYDLDYLGLLKVDILSLGMLTALKKILDQVGCKLHEIPEGDLKTYEMIQKADTVGTFQIESRAQMSMLGRLLPANFYDLVVQVAIVRPGPIVGKMVHPYLKRRRGLEQVTFPHPKLEKILKRTMGIPLYQEQVMSMAIELGGFTPGEADELRRAIGAWRSTGSIEKMGRRLMEGLMRSGLSADFAQRTFDQIQGFAMYGFPESHAASFALLAYASAFLKCHYPAEFASALINSQPMGFYSVHTLVDDARRHGVQVLPVDPNLSDWDCRIVDQDGKNAVRMGLRVVNGLSRQEAQKMLNERKKKPFSGLSDFMSRVRLKPRVLQGLAMGDAFACFGAEQRQTLWKILEYRILSDTGAQLSLFSFSNELPHSSDWSPQPLKRIDAIREDYSAYSLSTQGHPMQELRTIKRLPRLTIAQLKESDARKTVTVSGLVIIRQRPPTAKGMTFATLEDESGFLDMVLHPPVYEKYRDVFLENCFLQVSGLIQRDANSISFIVQSIRPLLSLEDEESWGVEASQYFSSMREKADQ